MLKISGLSIWTHFLLPKLQDLLAVESKSLIKCIATKSPYIDKRWFYDGQKGLIFTVLFLNYVYLLLEQLQKLQSLDVTVV